MTIVYPETGAETRFNAPRGLTVDAPAETFYENGTSLKGRVTGDISKGGNIIRLTVTRGSKYAPLILDGAVIPDNTPAGSFAWENNDRQNWESPTQFACLPGAPPPLEDQLPKRDVPEPVAAEQPAPAAQEAPAPQEAAAPAPEPAAPAPEPAGPCIPDPFGLDFPGAC